MRVPRRLPLLLGVLQAVGPVSTDMYLPAFPAMEAGLHAQPGSAQLTLATWFVGLAAGQFAIGALSDRFGRRAPLLVGTLVYTLGTALCALAGSIPDMAFWRFVAALGASASMIVPRAIVRDVADGHDAARLMSRLILVLGAAPILAPSLGGLVMSVAGWRDVFWIMTAYGAATFLVTWRLLPETLPPARRHALDPAATLRRSLLVLRDRGFISHTMMMSASCFALFAYLGGSPAVFIGHFGFSPAAYAIQFGCIAAIYILCSQLNVFAARALGFGGVLAWSSWVYLAMTLLLVVLALLPGVGPLPFALAIAGPLAMTGFIGPTASVGALHSHAGHAGTASALMGTLNFTIGAVSEFLVGTFDNGTALPMALLMAAGGIGLKIADLSRPKVASSKDALLEMEATESPVAISQSI